MTEAAFLKHLRLGLAKLPEAQRLDILAHYEEHIRTALARGLSEQDAIRALGNPREIARDMLVANRAGTRQGPRWLWWIIGGGCAFLLLFAVAIGGLLMAFLSATSAHASPVPVQAPVVVQPSQAQTP